MKENITINVRLHFELTMLLQQFCRLIHFWLPHLPWRASAIKASLRSSCFLRMILTTSVSLVQTCCIHHSSSFIFFQLMILSPKPSSQNSNLEVLLVSFSSLIYVLRTINDAMIPSGKWEKFNSEDGTHTYFAILLLEGLTSWW